MAARGLVERRNAHQAMHAAFAGEHAVGVFAFDLHGGGLDARFFAGRGIEDRGAKALFLGPAQIHAQKHFGPVLRFGAAGAGLDGDDGVQAVGFAGEQRFRFELGEIGVGGGEFLGEIFEERVALRVVVLFLREMDIGLDVADLAVERCSRR